MFFMFKFFSTGKWLQGFLRCTVGKTWHPPFPLHTQMDVKEKGQGWLGVIGGNLGILEGQLFRLQMSPERKKRGGATVVTQTLTLCHMCAHTHTHTHCIVLLCWTLWYTGALWDAGGVCGGLETASHPWFLTGETGVWGGNPVFRLTQRRSVLPMGFSSPLFLLFSGLFNLLLFTSSFASSSLWWAVKLSSYQVNDWLFVSRY